MEDQILLYISAATDLEAEREILGRAVTQVPVDIGWRVIQSPPGNGPVDLDAVVNADIHILLMGSDIRAPVGLEWQTARAAGRRPTMFLKQTVLRTPAGQSFVRMVRADVGWTPYASGTELRRQMLTLVADHILANAVRYALTPEEMGRLQVWRNELATVVAEVDETTRGGAGDSSILLSRDRFTPTGGVIIEPE